MLGLSVPATLSLKLPHLLQPVLSKSHVDSMAVKTARTQIRRPILFPMFHHQSLSNRAVLARVSNDGGGSVDANPHHSTPDTKEIKDSSSLGDSYVALFIRMLGLDYDALDREQAIVTLWKYSLGGKKCIDAIMQFPGCINLTVNLLRSESSSACEAAAGLLRSISLVNLYKDLVAESGAIEEITGLLSRSSSTSEVKEQCLATLWNLSVDEKLRVKIANADILPILIKSLDDENMKVKEAAGGVLANLALSPINHNIIVEAGAIPKLAQFLKTNEEGSQVIRKEARNALLELCKDEYYRILVIEEGLVPVPLIGAAAYKSFRPGLYSWPSLPDGTQIERNSKTPSRYGASELLLGLNIDDKDVNIEEAKMNAVVGRTQQQFLARIGAIEIENGQEKTEQSAGQRLTLLPWVDGVARLVLILGLEDETALSRAAESIADACINEQMRISFKEAGAVKHLVLLLGSNNHSVKLAASRSLEKLSVSNAVCQVIEAEGAIGPLLNTLKQPESSGKLLEKTLGALSQMLDPRKEMRLKFYVGPVNGSKQRLDAQKISNVSKGTTGNMSEVDVSKINISEYLLDSAVVARLIEILKTPSPNLQRKAASILEFITVIDPSMDAVMTADIEVGLNAVFQQNVLKEDVESVVEAKQPEEFAIEVEEAGLAISAASRLLIKLLDFEKFSGRINYAHISKLLRDILKSSIPLHYKDWVAACLVKLSSLHGPKPNMEDPVNMEVTLYEIIPRLVEQIKTSFSTEAKEAAVIELNRIISEGVVGSTQALASEGGIFPLVKLIEEGSDRAVEAGLVILYNLSMDSENQSAIVAAGAVPILRRIILSQRPNWTRALQLLRTLPT